MCDFRVVQMYFNEILCNHSSSDILIFFVLTKPFAFCCCYHRTSDTQGETAGKESRWEAPSHCLQRVPTPETEARISTEQLPDRTTPKGPGQRTHTEWIPDQNLVPEQASQNQEGHWTQERFGQTTDGTGSLQPFDGTFGWRRYGHEAHECQRGLQ